MADNDFSVDDENALYEELLGWQSQRALDQRNAGLELANSVDILTTLRPYGNPDIVMSVAEGLRDGLFTQEDALRQIDGAAEVDYKSQAQELDDTAGGTPEWLKTATRWTFAGLELVPQLATNTAMRAFNYMGGPGEEDWYTPADTSGGFFDGWFASTDFGAMLSGEDAGNGFFIGEKAFERQQEAVKAYRGMYDGNALTLGRGFAGIFVEPGSLPYNLMSGTVDFAQAVVVPSLPGLGIAGKASGKIGDAAGFRRLSGLTDFGSSRVVSSRANRWLDTRSGTRTAEYFAKVNSYEEMADILPKADYALRQDLVQATTVDDVKKILRNNLEDTAPTTDVLGRINVPQEKLGLGLRPGLTNIDDIKVGAGSRLYRGMVKRSSRLDKMGAPVPGRELKIDIDATLNPLAASVEATKTIDNARNYMRLVKASRRDRETIIRKMSEAFRTGDRAALKKTIDEDLTQVVAKGIATQQSKLNPKSYDFIMKMFQVYRRDTGDHVLLGFLNGNEAGVAAEALDDLIVASAKGDLVEGAALKLDTAHTSTEAAKISTFFPDPRRIRRVTSQFSPLWARMAAKPEVYGDPNKLVVGATFIAEKMFRTMSLLTGGYTTRNLTESALRTLNIPGVNTGPAHPIDWLRTMSRAIFKGDVDGNEFTQHGAKLARGALYDWEKAAGVAAREVQLDPAQAKIIGFQNGIYSLTARGAGQEYIEGIATEIRLLAGDEVARKLAGGWDVNDVVDWLKTQDGADYLRKLESRWKGRTLRDANGQEFRGDVIFRRTLEDGTEQFIDGNLTKFAESMYKRVQVKTGGRQSLREVIANAVEDGKFVGMDGVEKYAFANGRYLGAAVDEFERFDYTEDFLQEIGRLVGTDVNNELPSIVKTVKKPKTMPSEAGRSISEWADRTTRHFFSYVFGKKEGILNRSPVFRQLYYNKLDELMNAGELNAEAYLYMYKNITEAALKQPQEKLRLMKSIKPDDAGKYEWNGFLLGQREWDIRLRRAEKAVEKAKKLDIDDWAAKYVGSKSRWEKIKNGRFAANEQGISGEEASWVAKAFAADETQRAFFNAAEANNFVDVLRIAVPFGAAWKESMQYNLRQVALKPNRLRKVENTVRSIRDSDIDNDGNGFFYEDPVTGEMMFNVPFGREAAIIAAAYAGGIMTQTLTGGRGGRFAVGALIGGGAGVGLTQRADNAMDELGVKWKAPARSFSQVLQVFPGFGPAVQVPAARILGNKPEYKDVVSFIAPFGSYENVTDAVTPAWAKKFAQAITANPERDRWYADLYMDSFRALVASGKYDWSKPENMEAAQNQAHEMARSLLILRSLGQFTGPYRPEPELVVPTVYEGKINLGDVQIVVDKNIESSVLAATFRELQQEDYQSAVGTMLRAFGPQVLMYLPGMTQTEIRGLEATREFDNWYLDNRAVSDQFPEVYGFFADAGNEFDFQAYLRQLRSGERKRRSSTADLRSDAEAIVGRALYMDTLNSYGPTISRQERLFLQQYRADLEKQYPGFGTQAIDLNEQQRLMSDLEKMANDPRLDQNETALALREYFDARTVALVSARMEAGYTDNPLGSTANANLRQYLRDVGGRLMEKYPSFGRVYSRLLFDEIDER